MKTKPYVALTFLMLGLYYSGFIANKKTPYREIQSTAIHHEAQYKMINMAKDSGF
jgi:hypothetical protein